MKKNGFWWVMQWGWNLNGCTVFLKLRVFFFFEYFNLFIVLSNITNYSINIDTQRFQFDSYQYIIDTHSIHNRFIYDFVLRLKMVVLNRHCLICYIFVFDSILFCLSDWLCDTGFDSISIHFRYLSIHVRYLSIIYTNYYLFFI